MSHLSHNKTLKSQNSSRIDEFFCYFKLLFLVLIRFVAMAVGHCLGTLDNQSEARRMGSLLAITNIFLMQIIRP